MRQYLVDQLVALVAQQATSAADTAPEQGEIVAAEQRAIGAVLLDAALHLAIAARRSGEKTVAESARLGTLMVDAGRWIVPLARPFVQRLYGRLPIAEAHELAPLFVRLRAA